MEGRGQPLENGPARGPHSTFDGARSNSAMGEAVTIRDGKFLRPKKRGEGQGSERLSRWLGKALRVSFHLLILSFFLFLGHQVYVRLLEDPLFRVRQVDVGGCEKLPREALLSLAMVEGMPNLFTVKLKEISKRLEDHPWIEHVVVRKTFPNKVSIQIQERKPIAILQLEELYYIDAKGTIFSRVGETRWVQLPVSHGIGPSVPGQGTRGGKGAHYEGPRIPADRGERERSAAQGDLRDPHGERHPESIVSQRPRESK